MCIVEINLLLYRAKLTPLNCRMQNSMEDYHVGDQFSVCNGIRFHTKDKNIYILTVGQVFQLSSVEQVITTIKHKKEEKLFYGMPATPLVLTTYMSLGVLSTLR